MNIQEQITALLHGDMTNETHVAELMHVLAVSPEKQGILLEQIQMNRKFSMLGGSIAPPASADQQILGAIGMAPPIAGGAGSAAITTASVTAGGSITSRLVATASVIALILLSTGLGTGYWLGTNAATNNATQAVVVPQPVQGISSQRAGDGIAAVANNAIRQELGLTRDSLSAVRASLAGAFAERDRAVHGQAALQNKLAAITTTKKLASTDASNGINLEKETVAVSRKATSVVLLGLQTKGDRGSADELVAGTEPVEVNALDFSGFMGRDITRDPWRIEVRSMFRSSLPTVEGLPNQNGLFTDREAGYSAVLGGGTTVLPTPLRFGVALGETRFAQVYHTNTGGSPADTIYEQAPTLLYGRGYIAPQVFAIGGVTTSLELGIGGTTIGPIGTFGLDIEYRPFDFMSVHGGVSSWLLWTQFRNQIYSSTNLNTYFGFSFGP